jgi:hypothetical protein
MTKALDSLEVQGYRSNTSRFHFTAHKCQPTSLPEKGKMRLLMASSNQIGKKSTWMVFILLSEKVFQTESFTKVKITSFGPKTSSGTGKPNHRIPKVITLTKARRIFLWVEHNFYSTERLSPMSFSQSSDCWKTLNYSISSHLNALTDRSHDLLSNHLAPTWILL